MNTRINPLLCCIGLAFALTACTQTRVLKLDPQSHFTDPQGTITRMGDVKVHGEASKASFLFFGSLDLDSQVRVDAIKNALNQKPGANLLINVAHVLKVTTYPTPLLFIPVYKMTYEVYGQAAKYEIGRPDAE
ncbi:MAG: hypothetical protein ACKN9T_01445 [Candidatus Methylumidiphilus sp.]